jgi:hypothetical protein
MVFEVRARDDRSHRVRRALGWSAMAMAGASLALACASIIGIDDRLLDDVTADADAADDREVTADDRSNPPSSCPGAATCVDVPAGWQLRSLSPNKRPGCADGYGPGEDLVVAPDGVGCTCKCTETTRGSCAGDNTTTTFRDYPAAGCSASTTTYALNVLDGGCGTLPITTTPAVRIPTPAAGPPACAPDASPSRIVNGQACAAQGMACNDGGMCAAALPPGERLCVMKAGDDACPMGFPKKFPVGTATTTDDRQCGTCTCTPAATCDAPMLELFTGADCRDAGLIVGATGSCTNVDAGVSYASYRYSGTAPGCQPSVPPLLDGGVTIEGLRTVCCTNGPGVTESDAGAGEAGGD